VNAYRSSLFAPPTTATIDGRNVQGGFETLAELAPQPPAEQSSLLNHRVRRAP
jgi:hypothetical protein